MVHKKIIQFYKQLKGNQPHTHLCGLCAKLADHNEYRKLKEKYSLLILHINELCAYVTHLPVDNYNTDAAVLYKDIMTPLKPIGVDVEIQSV